ncbi:MAG: PAS domain S-box protein [Limisphaerales bacterium]
MATILIVDDRAVNRQYLVELLGYCGHRTLEAADGAEALALARTELPDLIITDIVMPTMDGAEMVRALRADPALAATPVVFYSASYRETEARAVAAGCGVSLVLSKPADPEVVLRFVNQALGSRAACALVPAGVKPPGPDLGLVMDALSQRLIDQQRSAARLAVLIELGLDLTSERDPAQLVQQFCKAARDIVTARFGSVGLLSEDGGTLAHFQTDGLPAGDEVVPMPFPLRGELAQLQMDGKPRRLSGTLQWSDLGLPDGRLTPSSFLGVPVATQRRKYGWLSFCNKVGATEFSVEDERLAITLAAQLALAYENVLLQEAADRDAQALRLQVSALSAAANAILITDTQGAILWLNPAFTALTGYTAAEAVGQNPRLLKSDRQDQAFYHDLWQTILRGENWRGEFINRRKDGSLYHTEETVTPVRSADGAITHFIGIMQDVTERRRVQEDLRQLNEDLERRVRERTRELETANEELQAFSYSVSHDLRAPLRAIDGFSRSLVDDAADQLNEQQKSDLQRIRKATQRMGNLINDLLGLARVARSELRRETADLSRLAEEALTELRQANPGGEVEGVVAPGLCASADGRLLRIVLQNLLGNAWKFSRNQPQPRVEFGAVSQDGETVYFVRDNGAGFDMAYADKLFGAFQRMHSQEEFEGTGVGLATVQRIIHRHGGRIWAEAAVDCGATFYFTLAEDCGRKGEDGGGEMEDGGEAKVNSDPQATPCSVPASSTSRAVPHAPSPNSLIPDP